MSNLIIPDYHIHTNKSDGDWNLEKIISYIDKLNQDELAEIEKLLLIITDHDFFNEEYQRKINDILNLEGQIFGAELSTYSEKFPEISNIHMTAYTGKVSNGISELLSQTSEKQEQKNITQIIELKKQEVFKRRVNINNIKKYFGVDQINSWFLSRYIEEYGIGEKKDNSEYIKLIRSLVSSKHELEFGENIDNIKYLLGDKYNKGFISLAHPSFTFRNNKKLFYEFLEEYGTKLNGIEINARAAKDWVKIILEAAKKYNFTVTFGSDSHGDHKDKFHGEILTSNPYIDDRLKQKYIFEFMEIMGIKFIK